MDKKGVGTLALAAIVIVVTIVGGGAYFLFSGEGEPAGGPSENQPTGGGETEEMGIPVYSGATSTLITSEMKSGFGITSDVKCDGYTVDASAENIMDWYKSQMSDWILMNENSSTPPEEPNITVYTQRYKKNDNGAFIFASSETETSELTTFGIVTGSWATIQELGAAAPGEEGQPQEQGPSEERIFPDYKYLPLPEGKITFNRAPLDVEDVKAVWPLGTYMSSEDETGHVFPTSCGYLEWKNPESYPPSIPVKAPADGYIVSVNKRLLQWPSGSSHSGTYEDYRIRIAVSKTQFTEMGHVSKLSEGLKDNLGTLEEGETKTELEVSKGELLGYTGGRPGAQYTMNWRVYDLDVRHFINPRSYGIRALESHFLDYSTDSLRSDLEPLSKRQKDPITGKFDFDEKGKLVGNWFHENAATHYDYNHLLSFCYNPYDLSSPRVNIGGTIAQKGVYSLSEGPDPENVSLSDGKVVLHLETASDWGGSSLPNKTLLVQLVSENTLKIQTFDGWVEEAEFSNSHIYARSC